MLIVRSRNGVPVRLTEERWRHVVDRPVVAAPLLAVPVAAAVTFLACLLIRGMDPGKARRGYRWG